MSSYVVIRKVATVERETSSRKNGKRSFYLAGTFLQKEQRTLKGFWLAKGLGNPQRKSRFLVGNRVGWGTDWRPVMCDLYWLCEAIRQVTLCSFPPANPSQELRWPTLHIRLSTGFFLAKCLRQKFLIGNRNRICGHKIGTPSGNPFIIIYFISSLTLFTVDDGKHAITMIYADDCVKPSTWKCVMYHWIG